MRQSSRILSCDNCKTESRFLKKYLSWEFCTWLNKIFVLLLPSFVIILEGLTNPDSEGFKLSFPLVPNFVTNPSQCFPHPFSLWHQLHWNIYVVTQSLCNLFSAIQNKYTKFKLKFNQTPENGRNVSFSSNATQNNKYRETVTNCEWMYVNSCVTTAWTGGTAWKSVCSQNHKNLL